MLTMCGPRWCGHSWLPPRPVSDILHHSAFVSNKYVAWRDDWRFATALPSTSEIRAAEASLSGLEGKRSTNIVVEVGVLVAIQRDLLRARGEQEETAR